jgi:pimeloyl-ACP methyl ester carboxylesterase
MPAMGVPLQLGMGTERHGVGSRIRGRVSRSAASWTAGLPHCAQSLTSFDYSRMLLSMNRVVTLDDGRRLAVEQPASDGVLTILLCHGTPGSARWRPSSASVEHAVERGVGLVTVSRPGYGGSDRLVDRSIASWANDVAELVAQLSPGQQFAVVGISGGGPHALACGLLSCTSAVAVLAGAGDLRPDHAFDGMAQATAELWRSAFDESGVLESLIRRIDRAMRRGDPTIVAARVLDGYPANAVEFLQHHDELRAGAVDDLVEAFAGGGWGWLDDARAFRSAWGFTLDDVRVPVWLAHGERDEFVPLHHAQRLVEGLPQAELHVRAGLGHMDLVDAAFDDAVDWIVAQAVHP